MKKTMLLLVLTFFLLPVLSTAHGGEDHHCDGMHEASAYSEGSMMWGGHMLDSGIWGFLGFLFWMVIIVLLVFIAILLYQRINETPLEALRKKYASGELSKKEYESRKKELKR